MGMDRLSEPRLRPVALYDLLDPPRSKRSTAACFEQVSVFGICLQVTLQYQPKAGWKQDIAVFGILCVGKNYVAMAARRQWDRTVAPFGGDITFCMWILRVISEPV